MDASGGRVALALWYHDAIYDTRAKDNEAKSAEFFQHAWDALGLAPLPAREAVAGLIRVTAHDGAPATEDEKLIVDIDLREGLVGSGENDFALICELIREEYAWVPEAAWKVARPAVLQGFLNRERIFSTDPFHNRFEATARTNIQAEIARLAAD